LVSALPLSWGSLKKAGEWDGGKHEIIKPRRVKPYVTETLRRQVLLEVDHQKNVMIWET